MIEKEEEKFIQIIQVHKAKIARICKAYAIQPLDPQDLFQEVVCEIWKSLASFKGKSELGTWVYRVALNVCYRAHHKNKIKNQQTIHLEGVKFEISSPQESPNEMKYQILRECITKLEEVDRSIIMLYLEELPYKDIADIVGLSANNIAVRVKRIKPKLLECIVSKQGKGE